MGGLLLVMTGGALGAALRYGVGTVALRAGGTGFPWGTLAVNLLGGLAMGVLAGWLSLRGGSDTTRLFLGTGVLGGFTTFSAFSLEVFNMLARGDIGWALGYVAASVLGSLALLWAGLLATRVLA